MPSLIIDNVPVTLYSRLQHFAESRQQTPAAAALEVLQTAFQVASSAPLPQEPFFTAEISAPCSIPRPEGKPANALRVNMPLPAPHDLADAE